MRRVFRIKLKEKFASKENEMHIHMGCLFMYTLCSNRIFVNYVEIPQLGIVKSLDVHVSSSIALWEYTRQQRSR